MLFNSYIFFIFLIIVLPVYYLLKDRMKNIHLLICSYFFYAYWDWRFCILLAISTIADFIIGKQIYKHQEKRKRKSWLIVSLLVNLGILGFFKYFNFFTDSFQDILSNFNVNLDFAHLNIILPVGISFYTFQTLSYTIDIYRNKMKPTNSVIDFAVFVSFFPQLVAGPIERAKNLLPQISKKPMPSKKQIQEGIVLIITGLFKKVIIGDMAGRFVDQIYIQPEYFQSPELVFATFMFSIQVYADFSGYSSIARGVAKLLGYEIVKNFEHPYLATNISEYWRRWHISLSMWLRDYLYIPLGGSRAGNMRTYFNLFLVFILGGLWHGANWTFVVWGGLQGIYMIIHRIIANNQTDQLRSKSTKLQEWISKIVKNVGTYLLILFAYIFFRSNSIDEAFYTVKKIIIWESGDVTLRLLSIGFGFFAITFMFDVFEYYTKSHTFLLKIKNKSVRNGILTALLITTLLFMFREQPMPFVYFQF